MAEGNELKTVSQVLKEFGEEIQREIYNKLKSKDAYLSGTLAQSVDFSVKIFATDYQFQLVLADYYDYVNKGVMGTDSPPMDTPYRRTKMPPVSKIKQWMNNKGLLVPKGATVSSIASRKTFKAGSHDSQAYAMARHLWKNGQKGNHFYDEVVTEERLKRLRGDIAKASRVDIEKIAIDMVNDKLK